MCLICHSKVKNIPGPDNTVIEKVSPSIPDRAVEIVNRLVDITAYIDLYYDENNVAHRRFVTRGTPTIVAGNRLPYLDPVIPFSYESLIDAINVAITKQEQQDGAIVVDTHLEEKDETLDYNALYAEAKDLWQKLIDKNPDNANIVLKKAEIYFGHPIRLSEITEDQVSILNLLVIDMREMDTKN